mmetsp:Transcript_64124/g.152963  ORF Transcript_64124/g.152963 Transcript_64124/m.152963 type:complete len:203 (-) Transcript_64124:142-750(-)
MRSSPQRRTSSQEAGRCTWATTTSVCKSSTSAWRGASRAEETRSRRWSWVSSTRNRPGTRRRQCGSRRCSVSGTLLSRNSAPARSPSPRSRWGCACITLASQHPTAVGAAHPSQASHPPRRQRSERGSPLRASSELKARGWEECCPTSQPPYAPRCPWTGPPQLPTGPPRLRSRQRLASCSWSRLEPQGPQGRVGGDKSLSL